MNSAHEHKVLSDVLHVNEGALRLAKQAALVVFGIVVLAVAAKIKVPMWPVPITLGTFAVLSIGAAYGARLGLVTIFGYFLMHEHLDILGLVTKATEVALISIVALQLVRSSSPEPITT